MEPNFPHGPSVPPQKKGMPVLAWVGIGCGGLLILCIVVVILLIGACTKKAKEFAANPDKAAAEMIIAMNPELKKISSNDAKGEMTVKTKDGKTMTFSYADLKEGKFRMSGPDGETVEIGGVSTSKLPAWLPAVPGLKATASTWAVEKDGKRSGLFSVTSSVTPAQADSELSAKFKAAGFSETSRTSATADGNTTIMLAFENGEKKSQVVIGGKSGEDTTVSYTYEEPK